MRLLARLALAAALLLSAAPAFAQKAYLRSDLAGDGQRLEEKLKRDVAAPGRPAAALVADGQALLAKGDARAALPLANAAVVSDPRAMAGWLLLARAAVAIQPKDYGERYDLRQRAIAAAYMGYQRAVTKADEASALAVLGQVFVVSELWRPALTVYRLSLEAADRPDVRATYEKLRETRGFRILSDKVDADSANPRVCFQFSEQLATRGVDFTPYVAISGGKGDFAVSAEGTQLCVDGLRHGERYAMVVRQGVPSVITGETLLKSADYDIYVRDRAPSVRFTGKNYVLPRTGQQGLPVVSVNTSRLDLEIMRIGDRNLINQVQSEDFLTQLGGYAASKIADETGQRVWKGTMDVKPELNRDVVTAFPVLEAVGQLQAGLYVMFARPSGTGPAPADGGDPDYANRPTQWFVVSDLGLTSFSGPDGVHVLVRSLASAAPLKGVELRLLARNNEILARLTTDENGYARFDAGLAHGTGGMAPGLVVAVQGDDYGFLDLKQTAFDLSDRGVKGRVAPVGLDAFLYAERGVYRSGETAYVTALLRDPHGTAVANLPLTLVVKRPDGVEYKRQVVEDQGAGGRAFAIPLLSGAQTGTWRVQAYSDPKGSPVGETSFLVEDYVPETLEATLSPRAAILRAGEPAAIDVDARYLYGAPGAGLDVSGSTTVRVAEHSAIPGFAGYAVGLTDEAFDPVQADLEGSTTTDAKGHATLQAAVAAPDTTRPLEVEIALRIGEPGGRALARSVTLPIVPAGAAIGVKPLFAEGALAAGGTATFDVIMASGDGTRLAQKDLRWTLSKISRSYQWFYKDGQWNYEAVKSTRRVADGTVDAGTDAPARIAAKVDWGEYRLDVQADGADAAQTSVGFHVGYETEKTADTPDVLDVSLDRSAYAAGETMQVRLAPRFAGKATLAVISDRVEDLRVVDVAAAGTTVAIPVKAGWGAGAYVVVLAHRPLDTAAKRLPGRAIGLAWFGIDKAAHALSVDLGAPPLIRPHGTLSLPVKIAGAAPGEPVFVTVAAVDAGILSLTGYKPPDASAWFFGQRQIGHDLRDLYGYLIDGMQGTRGTIRSGGDAAPQLSGDAPTQAPLARYSGVVKVGPDGTAPVSFDIPDFNGTVRVMAVAWSRDRTGQASADVVVRDPVVTQATLPRFLGVGDQSRLHLQIDNVEGPAGDYVLDLDVSGPVVVPATALHRTVTLAAKGRASIAVPVTAAGIGTATFEVRLAGAGIATHQSLTLGLRATAHTIARRVVEPVPGGGAITLSADLAADMVPGTATVSVSVSPLAALDVPALLKALDRYPYGCTEQTVSRALPLLYVNRLAAMDQLALDGEAGERTAKAVERVLARQGANGSFGLWDVGGDDLWLDAFVGDFLTRAREHAVPVPQLAFTMALDRLRNQVTNAGEIRPEEASGIAYALYVLARNGRPVMGDLRYLADNKLEAFATPLAKAQLAAALALLGDRTRAKTAYDAALASLEGWKDDGLSRPDYGSRLRDGTGILALLAEGNAGQADIVRASAVVEQARGRVGYTSTQENMWMVLAAEALAKQTAGLDLTVNGAPHKGALYRTVAAASLEGRPITIGNPGQATARAVVTVSGVPATPEPALQQGYRIERTIYSMKGEPVDPAGLRQNGRYVVVLKVTDPAAAFARLLLVDPLPAGLEIENPALTDGASLEGLKWFKQDVAPTHVEARDDRYVAAFERSPDQKVTNFSVAYIARAVTPGRYVQAAATVEDMYRPERFGRTAFGTAVIAPAR